MGDKSSKKKRCAEELLEEQNAVEIHTEQRTADDDNAIVTAIERQHDIEPVAKKGKSAPVLPWMRVPITIDPSDGTLLEEVSGLDPRLLQALQSKMNIEVLFPVQTVVWRQLSGGSSQCHDMCIAAPTGSGKTLAYTLPIVQKLATRTVPRLRALIILPTRDLALQVVSVLEGLCEEVGLKVVSACGAQSLAEEAAALCSSSSSSSSISMAANTTTPPADIVVATPGRLMAHLSGTPGFTLQHVEYLVVDETDRLLRQSYQGWLQTVMAALPCGGSFVKGDGNNTTTTVTKRVIKFVVSATLTRDPAKINKLDLYCPRYISMSSEDHRYKLPKGLEESKLVIAAEKKPYALSSLLLSTVSVPTIIFTSSLEATHRLYLMLKSLKAISSLVAEYSSLVSIEHRSEILRKFRTGKLSILVSSDAMTRGMDLENVSRVINYDAPVYVKTYVHRAGRAARANKQGSVVTLLRKEDVKHFKDMLRKVDNTYVKDYHIDNSGIIITGDGDDNNNDTSTKQQNRKAVWDDESLRNQVNTALACMGEILEEERIGAASNGGNATSNIKGGGENRKGSGVLKKRKLPAVPQFS